MSGEYFLPVSTMWLSAFSKIFQTEDPLNQELFLYSQKYIPEGVSSNCKLYRTANSLTQIQLMGIIHLDKTPNLGV